MDLFVTVFYCIYDPASGVLEYANGGRDSSVPPTRERINRDSRWRRQRWCLG